jgi:OmpA-OmpF porin, OOP family
VATVQWSGTPHSFGLNRKKRKKEHIFMKIRTLAAAAVLSLAALPSFAQSWYAGVGIGRGDLNIDGTELGLPNAQVGDNATTYTVRFGYRFNPYLGIELGYYDHGEYDFSSDIGGVAVRGTAKAKSVGLSVVGNLPIGDAFDVYGRLGYANSELKANASAGGFTASDKDHQRGMTYGVGARWNVQKNWGVFAEWMKNDEIEVDSYLVGFDFRF